jgi:hypothetical protein
MFLPVERINKDMYPSCTLIISIKQLCFFPITLICLFGNYPPTNILQISQLTYHHFLLEFSELALSSASPYACMGPAPYALSGQQVLSDRIYVLLRVYKLCASLSDHMSDQGHTDS